MTPLQRRRRKRRCDLQTNERKTGHQRRVQIQLVLRGMIYEGKRESNCLKNSHIFYLPSSSEQSGTKERPEGQKQSKKQRKEGIADAAASIAESSQDMAKDVHQLLDLSRQRTSSLQMLTLTSILTKDLSNLDEETRAFYEAQKTQFMANLRNANQ